MATTPRPIPYYVAVAPDGTPIVLKDSHTLRRTLKFAVLMLREPEEDGLRHWWAFGCFATREQAVQRATDLHHDYEHSVEFPIAIAELGRIRWTGNAPEQLRYLVPANGAPAKAAGTSYQSSTTTGA